MKIFPVFLAVILREKTEKNARFNVKKHLDVFLMKQEIYSAIAFFTSGARDVQSSHKQDILPFDLTQKYK